MSYALDVACGSSEHVMAATVAIVIFVFAVVCPFSLLAHWLHTAVTTKQRVGLSRASIQVEGEEALSLEEDDFDWDQDTRLWPS